MHEIQVPKLNSNDTSYQLIDWLVEDGERVAAGDPVAVVETSKATEEITAEDEGILRQRIPVDTECASGDVIGQLFASEDERAAFSEAVDLAEATVAAVPVGAVGSAGSAGDTGVRTGGSLASAGGSAGGSVGDLDGPGVVLTDGARDLAEAHGIAPARLAALGLGVIRRTDVERLLAESDPRTGSPSDVSDASEEADRPPEPQDSRQQVHSLDQHQRAVASVVSESHRTIPAAYAAVRVRVDAAIARARDLASTTGCPVGLPELLVRAVAELHEEFPLFFGELSDDGNVRLADAPHVGVTIDVGRGLFVPVVRNANRPSLQDIARTLAGFRVSALRANFRERDLTDGRIVLALHNADSVTQAIPIVFPGQVCAVSLPAVRQELRLDEEGRPVAESVVDIGLAYDHRVVNGREAVEFLSALRARLERVEEWA